jgi:hypothetical protein
MNTNLIKEQQENAGMLLDEIEMYGLSEFSEITVGVILDALASTGLQLVGAFENNASLAFLDNVLPE